VTVSPAFAIVKGIILPLPFLFESGISLRLVSRNYQRG